MNKVSLLHRFLDSDQGRSYKILNKAGKGSWYAISKQNSAYSPPRIAADLLALASIF